MEVDFEKSFSDFLEREEYDWAEQALFATVRAAYKAGWKAAGGQPPQRQNVMQIIKDKEK
ncbi:MAG: hypothetical protein IJH07_06555 [Ruminococcus sp.]|nr:hypothetical protein [Ruminococcus sp.]